MKYGIAYGMAGRPVEVLQTGQGRIERNLRLSTDRPTIKKTGKNGHPMRKNGPSTRKSMLSIEKNTYIYIYIYIYI